MFLVLHCASLLRTISLVISELTLPVFILKTYYPSRRIMRLSCYTSSVKTVRTTGDLLSVWTNLGKHVQFVWLCVSSIKTGTTSIENNKTALRENSTNQKLLCQQNGNCTNVMNHSSRVFLSNNQNIFPSYSKENISVFEF